MSGLLARLGGYSYAHPARVLLAWLVAVAAVLGLLATQSTVMSTGLTLDETPAQRVLDTISAKVPQARGTQGSLIFTAADGGRVDTPERAAAIARALDEAQRTGHVVDREAKLAAQRADAENAVRATVEAKTAATLTPRLASTASALADAVTSLERGSARAGGRSGDPAVASLTSRIKDLAARAQNLAGASPKEQIAGAGALFAELNALRAQAESSGLSSLITLPDPPTDLGDPQAEVEQAVAKTGKAALAGLDRLTFGTDPTGTPLVVGDRTYRTVLVSDDGRTAIASLQLSEQVSDLRGSTLDDLLDAAQAAAAPAGLTMSATSSLLPVSPPLGGHEAVGLVIAAIVLLLTLGSLLAAGLPILTALTGVFIGVGGAFALSAHYQMTTSTPALGLMIGLAVGIDYALFIVHKHRTLVTATGRPAGEAIRLALGTAGSAVLFAGLTVVIALLGLLTLGIAFVNTMALTAATTVALAVLIALTALPALLGLVGERIAGAKARDLTRRGHEQRLAGRWVSLVTGRPVLTLFAVTALLGLAAVPALDLRLGMPAGDVAQAGSSARTAYDAITRSFGEGVNAPLVVTARTGAGTAFDQQGLLTTQQDLARVEGVVNVALMGASPATDLAIYQVTPAAGPTAEATQALVTRLRAAQLSGLAPLGVTGLTAMNIDLSEVLAAAVPAYVTLVVVLSLLVMLVVFRSLLVPLAATTGFLLSMAATAGLVVTVFENPDWTWLVGVDRAGPILSFLPIMATGVLYGLANDYQVFLGTSMREAHVHGAPAQAAVRAGFLHAGRVVVAAAVIMVSVFGGFVLSSDTTIRQFGFALSAGILIDAFGVRMTLMPAILHLAGHRAWWLPRWLDRLLPTIDIEGDRLRRTTAQGPSDAVPGPEVGASDVEPPDGAAPGGASSDGTPVGPAVTS